MAFGFEETLTQSDVNGLISLFCHYYKHQELFDYSSDMIGLETCNLEILNGLYSDEELIVESSLKLKLTEELAPNQSYKLAFDYYAYDPDMDDELPKVQRQYFDLTVASNGETEISLDDTDVFYILLENWELVTSFDKPIIEEVS